MMARPKRVLMFLVDGFDPEYVQPARMPRLAALMKAGASTLDGRGVLPSLTNVNHVSLLTGTYPARHGLSTNFFYDRATRTDVFMEQVSFVQEGAGLFGAAADDQARLQHREQCLELEPGQPV